MNKRMKRLISIVLALIFTSSVYAYTDVPDTDPDYEVINYIADLGVLNGYEDGSFRPDNVMTRAEMTKIIVAAMDWVLYLDENLFYDVPQDYWAAPWISVGYSKGIVNGDRDNYFHPEDFVTYEEAVKTIIFALKYDSTLTAGFVYPDSYINSAKELGIIDDSSGTVGELCTRRQFVKMLYNSLKIPIYSYCAQRPIADHTILSRLTVYDE